MTLKIEYLDNKSSDNRDSTVIVQCHVGHFHKAKK